MKILYVDISLDGHREVYLRAFEPPMGSDTHCWCMLPEPAKGLRMGYVPMTSGYDKTRDLKTYWKFLREIRAAVKKYDIDIVHFLCGDALYRFFGVGLSTLKAKIVITYHHMVFTRAKTLSIQNLFRQSIRGVVHTDFLLTQLEAHGVHNGTCIYYPMFDRISDKTTEQAKSYFGTDGKPTVLGVVGATSSYKGLDILLDALNRTEHPCTLLVAGSKSAFGAEDIEARLNNPLVEKKLHLRRLSDEEFADAIQAADVIMLPYRKEFDGASGPLVSAAVHNKPVIAADHGSLGDIVTRYELGLCFESENAEELAKVLNSYLAAPDSYEFKVEAFCKRLTVEAFLDAYRDVYVMG